MSSLLGSLSSAVSLAGAAVSQDVLIHVSGVLVYLHAASLYLLSVI